MDPNTGQPTKEEATPEVNKEQPKLNDDDLMKRVAEFATTNNPENQPSPEVEGKFDFNDIETIQDPIARETALKAYKSFQSDFTKKYQDLSALRKELEQAREVNNTWTPERVEALTKDPTFIQAAQQVGSQLNDVSQDDYSALSDVEKQEITRMKQELNMLKQQTLNSNKAQQDEVLRSKYPNYNPQAIDTLTAELLEGKRQATREDLWKVHNYKAAVNNAYKLGLQDKQQGVSEQINSMSMTGGANTVTTSNAPLQREEGESNRAYAKRSFKQSAGKVLQSIMPGHK